MVEPSEAEWLVLAAAGWSPTTTKWRAYHALRGSLPSGAPVPGELGLRLRNALVEHLERAYGAFVYRDPENVGFAPGVRLEPILRLGDPGRLAANPDDPLLVEMPDKASYDHAWEESGGVRVPFRVRARANMRMAATGTDHALVWVVAEMGAIDHFHGIALDPDLVDRLRAAVGAMVARVTAGQEPDPEEDDMDDAMTMLEGRPNALRKADPDDPLHADVDAYQAIVGRRLPLDRQSTALKEKEWALKARIERALLECPAIELSDGRVVTGKTIHKAKQATRASKWFRLDVLPPKTGAHRA